MHCTYPVVAKESRDLSSIHVQVKLVDGLGFNLRIAEALQTIIIVQTNFLSRNTKSVTHCKCGWEIPSILLHDVGEGVCGGERDSASNGTGNT